MRKLVLGFSAAALVATATFAGEEDNTRMATANLAATFTKLDADADGRVSAIEATNDTKVAAGFTAADANQDGYLSKGEFSSLGKGRTSSSDTTPAAPQSDSSTTPDPTAAPVPRQ